MPDAFINCYLLSLNLELASLASLAGQQVVGIFLSLAPQHCDDTDACHSPWLFDMGSGAGAGYDSGPPHAYSKHFTY